MPPYRGPDRKNPTYTVTLKGTRDYEFSIYEEQDKKSVPTSSENDYVFLVPEWRMKEIKLDIDALVQQGSSE